MKLLLAANKRLTTAYYMLKESFGQLWDYQREGWARRFFDLLAGLVVSVIPNISA